MLITVLILSSLIMVESALAQSIPKPSVPEFRLSYTNHVYDVPPTISQWSGEPIPNTGYHVDYREVNIKVRNYPNDKLVDDNANGLGERVYFNVRVKNHFSNVWTELRGRSAVWFSNGTSGFGTWYYGSSDSEVTYVSINLNGPTNIIHTSTELAVGNQVDFQVKALIGYQNWEEWAFFGEESAWSDTQTLTIEATTQTTNSSSPSPASTPGQTAEPSQSQTSEPATTEVELTTSGTSQTLLLGILIGAIASIALASVGFLIYFKKRKRGGK
jgi:hypothetical protein